MPVFNRQELAPRAIKSVLDQTDIDFELIVVDDGSTEPAESVYQEAEQRGHRVLRLGTSSGPAAARNAGVSLARGRWLAFLDSDDYWLAGKLREHIKSLEESGLRIGQTDEIWYRNGERVNPPKAHKISQGDLFKRSLRAVCVSSSTVVLQRDLFLEMGGFDEEFFVCEDYELWLRVAASEHFDFCPQALVVKHGGHEDQLSRALPAMDRYRILAIAKGLRTGHFASQEQEAWALAELARKLRILSKGSAKRELHQVIELCAQMDILVSEVDYAELEQNARILVGLWPTKPGD